MPPLSKRRQACALPGRLRHETSQSWGFPHLLYFAGVYGEERNALLRIPLSGMRKGLRGPRPDRDGVPALPGLRRAGHETPDVRVRVHRGREDDHDRLVVRMLVLLVLVLFELRFEALTSRGG